MPSYGSQSNPSLRKMENGYGQTQRSTFSVGRIIGDPFALATISIAIVSTVLARNRPSEAEC
jgi:SHO1 osmosensor